METCNFEAKDFTDSSLKSLISIFEVIQRASSNQLELKLNKICRTCLCETLNTTCMTSYVEIEGKSLLILEIFTSFTNLKFMINDAMPKIICSRCLQNAKFAYYFKRQCEEANDKLLKILDTSTLHISDEKQLIEEALGFSDLEDNTCSNMDFQVKDDLNNEDLIKLKNEKDIRIIDDSSAKMFMSQSENIEKCTICYETVKNVKQHMKCHTERNYTCEECGKSYTTRHDLKNHSIVHSIHRPYKCLICTKDFKHKFKLKEHMRGHDGKKEFVCENCGKGFNRAKELVTHKRVHTGIKPFVCSVCGKNFVGSDTLAKHMKTHTGEKNYVCEHCLKSFIAKDQLKVHIRKHTGEKPYICSVEGCTRKFATVHGLKMHMPVHSDIKPFHCFTCGKAFAREQDKRKHENIHTRQSYPCSWNGCSRSYTCQTTLKEHLATHSGEKQALCTHCGKSFARKADLKRHIFTHTQERPYKCKQCGKGFNQQFGLTQHLRYHDGKACFICDLCGKGFMRKATLEKHKLIHSGVKNHTCEYCNRAFTISAHLIRHRRIHTGERPYECSICNKAFTTRSGYVVHLRSHTGEKPYQCKYCEKTCATSTALKIHTRNHTGEKPYICPQCGTAFSRSDLRSLHMKTCCPDNLSEIIAPHQIPQEFYMMDNNLASQLSADPILVQTNTQLGYSEPDKVCNSVMHLPNPTNIHGLINIPGTSKDIIIAQNHIYDNQLH